MRKHRIVSVLVLQMALQIDGAAYAQRRTSDMSNAAQEAYERCLEQLHHEKYREACSTVENALRTDPSNPHLLELLGHSCIGLQENNRAMDAYTQAIRHGSCTPIVYNNRGNLYASRKDWVHAIEDFSIAIKIDPSFPGWYYGRARCYLARRQYAKSRVDFEESYNRGCGDFAAVNLAQLLATCPDARIRDGKKAIEYALHICETTDFNDPFYLDVLAMAYAESSLWKEAVQRTEQAIKIVNKRDDVSQDYPRGLRLRLELYRCHEPFRRLSPEHPSDWCNSSPFEALLYGAAKISEGDFRGGVSDVKKAIELNPRLASAYCLLGYAKTQLGQADEGIGYFDRCLNLDPNFSEAFADRSVAYCILGKFHEGLSDSKKALIQSPGNTRARLSHAWALGGIGDLNQALRELDQLKRKDFDHDMIHFVRGNCYLRLGRYDDAVGELTYAIQRNSQSALAYAERAVALSALNRDKEAACDLRECIRLIPSVKSQTEERMRDIKDKVIRK